jgi:glycosyltransferase involved in cell wall biosynthesis
VVADSRSSLVRKNVAAAVEAFGKAFGPEDKAELILKLSDFSDEMRRHLDLTAISSRTRLITSRLSQNEMTDIYRQADVLLSMHRAEGFGLHMLEAMAHGKPVVATKWSGNLDFMNDENSLLIEGKMVPIHDPFVYKRYRHACWAEASVDQAAEALRTLYERPSLATKLGQAARSTVESIAENWQVPSAGRETP